MARVEEPGWPPRRLADGSDGGVGGPRGSFKSNSRTGPTASGSQAMAPAKSLVSMGSTAAAVVNGQLERLRSGRHKHSHSSGCGCSGQLAPQLEGPVRTGIIKDGRAWLTGGRSEPWMALYDSQVCTRRRQAGPLPAVHTLALGVGCCCVRHCRGMPGRSCATSRSPLSPSPGALAVAGHADGSNVLVWRVLLWLQAYVFLDCVALGHFGACHALSCLPWQAQASASSLSQMGRNSRATASSELGKLTSAGSSALGSAVSPVEVREAESRG